jgi:hypothetical protein
MPDDALLDRARALWIAAAGSTVAFGPPGTVSVVVAPQSRVCPPEWVGIVVLGRAAIVTVPTDPAAQLLDHVLVDLTPQAITDVDHLTAVLPVTDALGPATLSYLDVAAFRPAPDSVVVEELLTPNGDLNMLLAAAGDADTGESGLAGITSSAFIHRERGAIVAAAGCRRWPGDVAHLCVLTAPQSRGRGLAPAVASAATAHALSHALFPQWRARPPSSRRVAAALGFRVLGAQLSIKLGAAPHSATPRHSGLRRS